jgi:hypothetical protein
MIKNLLPNKILLLLFALVFAKPFKAQHGLNTGTVVTEGVTAPCSLCYSMSNVNVGLTCPATGTFYDSGGSGNNYNNSENFTKTFTVPVGNCISFAFNTFSVEPCCDFLSVYDGPNNTFPLIGTYSGFVSPGVINSTGNSLCFVFSSDASVVYAGWDATPSCVPSCTAAPVPGTAQAAPSQSCVTYNSTLSLSGGVYACGKTYQWQRASNIAGPYSNIAGATSLTAAVNNTVTTFYRCVVTCGGFTAASSPATCSLVPAGSCGLCNIQSIASLPFNSGSQTTCGNGDNVDVGNVANICGSSFYYSGQDAVYSFTPSTAGTITLGVVSPGTYLSLALYQGCPASGGICIGYSQNYCCTWTLCANVNAGQAYYAVVDEWSGAGCFQYTCSISAPGPCVGTISGVTASGSPTQACGSLSSTLTLSGVAACYPTYQWQQSASPGGPWTNIAGQTSATAAITTTQTLYYQCFLSCGGNTAVSSVQQLSVSAFTPPPCSLNSYAASSVTFSYESFGGTVLSGVPDDGLASVAPAFGFPFCFAGQSFNTGYVASNNAFVFDGIACFPNIYPWSFAVYAGVGVSTGWSISMAAPTVNDYTPRNAILCPWEDLYPPAGGTIKYTTLGTAPNRRFIVAWDNVAMYSCTTLSCSTQLKLFETTNNIEIHVATKTLCPSWNSGQAILGLHNYDGTIYVPPVNMTAHNAPTQWTMSNTAYKFSSSCPSQSICGVVLPVAFKAIYGQNVEDIDKLWWETISEENMKEFQVERSMDAINFEVIQTVPAVGKANTYLYNDNSFKHGYVNYYRVTGIDKNGGKHTTGIYPIYSTEQSLMVTAIFPNPANDKLSVGITGRGPNTDCSFVIYDQFGKVLQKEQKVVGGNNLVDIDISILSKGIYIIEIRTSDNMVISKQKFTKM